MLFNVAEALRTLKFSVRIVAPAEPSAVAEQARSRGFDAVVLPASTRLSYMKSLRRWHKRNAHVILWCNGLVPAAATAGRRRRIVHLHQLPTGLQRIFVVFARVGALATLVPSQFVGAQIRKSEVMLNWVEPVQTVSNTVNLAVDTVAVGFLGRPSVDKGVAVLAEAMTLLDGQEPGRFRLVLAGEARFVPTGSQYLVERALAGVVHMVDRTGWITPDNFLAGWMCSSARLCGRNRLGWSSLKQWRHGCR